jgi:transposase InsO family protein
MSTHEPSQRRACRVIGIGRSAQRYAAKRIDDTSIVDTLSTLAERHPRYGFPKPERVCLNHGPEFTSDAFGQWPVDKDIDLDFNEPGKPTQNAFIERFNGTYL